MRASRRRAPEECLRCYGAARRFDYSDCVTSARVETRPITRADANRVARFLHENLNSQVSAAAWTALLDPPWHSPADNSGFQLVAGGRVVGVYAAVYSEREVSGVAVPLCNLAAFCVLEDFRTHGLLLVRSALKQKGFVFTDLSPSGNVVAMNERLGFRHLDTSTKLVANLPRFPRRGVRVSGDPAVIAPTLTGRDEAVFRDHRDAPAARHLIVTSGDRYAYLVYRVARRKRMGVFAAPLYAGGDRDLLESAWPSVSAHLLRRGLLATLAERRILGFAKGVGVELSHPRPKMVRGDVGADDLDDLYSELALVQW